MDYRIIWSGKARDDVDAIAAYISQDSPYYANAVVNKIVRTAQQLFQFPYRGHIVPELDLPHIRECFIYSYRLIYRISENTVTIAAVIHGKRILDLLFDEK